MIGPSLRPRSVSRYSTVGGLEGMTVRCDEPRGLEVAQALGEHPRRDAGDGLGELVEAQRAGERRVDDR